MLVLKDEHGPGAAAGPAIHCPPPLESLLAGSVFALFVVLELESVVVVV
jgi:hypothetical protein